MAPCIIFIDEIDAIGRSRDTRHMGGDTEREQTLNQLLSEMDGFDTSKGLIVLAATNRPEVLDKALLRPGRFDRRVIVEKPDLKGREDIIKVHTKNVKLDETVDFHELALATSGSVGADLANIVNEAALRAVRMGRNAVSQKDLIESVEVVFAGKEKKDRILSQEEKRIVAYHETGHALISTLQKHKVPIQRITIIPRTMGTLGYVWHVPEDEKYLESKAELEAQIVVFMAGRAAEQIKFDSVTSGAANDIEQATGIAKAMVTKFGMSERLGMVQMEETTGQYLDNKSYYNCSDQTAAMVDEEVRRIIGAAYQKAVDLLKKNEKILDAIAEFLVEHETITGQEFMEIFERVTKDQKVVYDQEPKKLIGKIFSSDIKEKITRSSKVVEEDTSKTDKKSEKKAEKKAEKKLKKEAKKEAKLKALLKSMKKKEKYKAYKDFESSPEYYKDFSLGDDEDDGDDEIDAKIDETINENVEEKIKEDIAEVKKNAEEKIKMPWDDYKEAEDHLAENNSEDSEEESDSEDADEDTADDDIREENTESTVEAESDDEE